MILVFGGTTEGRIVTQVLDESGKEYYYSTKGDLQQVDFVHGIRLTGAMTEEALIDFIQQNDIELVIDAAHPFAAVLHNTIGLATAQTGTPVFTLRSKKASLSVRATTI